MRKSTRDGFRVCNRCNLEKEATTENFLRDSSRNLGLAYECKPCHRERKIGRDRRSDRWANHTPEQRINAKARQYKYNRTDRGRACSLANAYKKIDRAKGRECDIDRIHLLENVFTKPCIYCGTTNHHIGCDRIDNSKGHTKANTVPSCATCNMARGDRLSHKEMLIVGKLIAKIMQDRTGD